MPISKIYYINSSDFKTATSVYTDVALSIKAPDGYYSFSGTYRQQLFGKLLDSFNCDGSPISINCVVSDWSAWSECVSGYKTRTRTVITPASNGGTACPVLTETQSCTGTVTFTDAYYGCTISGLIVDNKQLTVSDGPVTFFARIDTTPYASDTTGIVTITINGITKQITNAGVNGTFDSESFTLNPGTYNYSITLEFLSGTGIQWCGGIVHS